MFEDEVLARGSARTVVAAAYEDRFPALEFLRELNDVDQHKMAALFQLMADAGAIRNRQKFKKLQGDLWEFKSHQIRMPCVQRPGRIVVVTHGLRKKKDDLPPQEIERALRIARYFDEHARGTQ